LGTPFADRLIPDLVAFNGSTDFTVGPPPVVAKGGKSKHHFTTGVDSTLVMSAGRSVESGIGSLRSLAASSVDGAYGDDVKQGAILTLVDAMPAAPTGADVSGASSRPRLGSAKRLGKAGGKSASGGVGAIDAVFAGLGDRLTAA
jgi:hypothetical protein